jgi:23S rRNA pseudouridine955/2504/2580 synthase
LVHRLDKETSGVLLVAKTRQMAAALGEIFRSRQTLKIYWAIVMGVPKPAQGKISLFLAKGPGMGDDRSSRFSPDHEKMRITSQGDPEGAHSLTHYALMDKIAPRLAWLSLMPVTGRTHQLRVHAEAMGHPIVGDQKYGGNIAQNDPRRTDPFRALPAEIEPKLHLLARRLILPHPKGGMIDVTAPLPDHMQKTFNLFGFDVKRKDPMLEIVGERHLEHV